MEYAIKCIVILVGITAGIWDFKTYKIPNFITFPMILLGLILGLTPYVDFLDSLYGMLIGFGAFFPFYLAKGMGAGDVKLAAGFGALMGLGLVINAVLFGAILGGIASIIMIKYHRMMGTKPPLLPYGVFISTGAIIALFYQII